MSSSDLKACRDQINRVRFAADRPPEDPREIDAGIDHVKDHFLKHGLFIERSSAPGLSAVLETVCDRLQVPRKAVSAFVQASPDIQAFCVSNASDECVLHFSSALINLLSEAEFAFVAGHEIGHFLYEHYASGCTSDDASLEDFLIQRYQEISVDRVGLIACGDTNVAIKALIKLVSGLEDRHLKFDATQFISQVSKVANPKLGEHPASSHPSMSIRCRALIWFAMNSAFKTFPDVEQDNMVQIDQKISDELKLYVDGPLHQMIDDAENDLKMWMSMEQIVEDGRFDKQEQEGFKQMFGEQTLEKMLSFLTPLNRQEIKSVIATRIESCKEKLAEIVPESFSDIYANIEQQVLQNFR